MASGFIFLPDGRCWAWRWVIYDEVLSLIAARLCSENKTAEVGRWLLKRLPGPNDSEELGYHAWYRTADGANVLRCIDLRLLNSTYQDHFCEAVNQIYSDGAFPEDLKFCLGELVEMIACYKRGENPLSKSHLVSVLPPNIHSHAATPLPWETETERSPANPNETD